MSKALDPDPKLCDHGILSSQDIEAACAVSDTAVIQDFNPANVKSAGYDMRLGTEYYFHPGCETPSICILKLDETHKTIILPPNRLVYVTMKEQLRIPSNMVGHLSLKLDLLMQGIMMSSQSQIGAGYDGRIFALLYNLSDRNVSLTLGEPILRLELVRLRHDSERPYVGDYEEKGLAESLQQPIQSSLASMRRLVETAQADVAASRTALEERLGAAEAKLGLTQLVGGIVALLAVIVPVVLSWTGPLMKDLNRMRETKVDISQVEIISGKVESLNEDLSQTEEQLESLRAELRELLRTRPWE